MVVKKLSLVGHPRQRIEVATIHPFPGKHNSAISVIQNASTPSHAITPLALVLDSIDVGVVLATITRILLADSESLVHSLIVRIVQHTPAIRLTIQHVTLPTIAVHTQIHNLVVLSYIQFYAFHA